jgi:hypothetical protein
MCRDVPRPDTILRPRSTRRVKGAARFLARRELSHAQKIGDSRFSSMASTGPLTRLSTVASLSARGSTRCAGMARHGGVSVVNAVNGRSIAAEATWRLDGDEIVKIEIDDGLQSGAGGGVTQIVRQDVIPGGVFGLQCDQPGDRVMPALRAGTPVGWAPVADDRRGLLGFATRAVTCLAFGVAERVLTFGLSASGHDLSTVM